MTKAIDELLGLLEAADAHVTFYGQPVDASELKRRTALSVCQRLRQPLTVERAAIRCMGLVFSVPRPGRHGHVIQAMVEVFGEERHEARFTRHQGFLLSDGSYVDREAAWRIAKATGQLIARAPTDGCGGRLYSEDVW